MAAPNLAPPSARSPTVTSAAVLSPTAPSLASARADVVGLYRAGRTDEGRALEARLRAGEIPHYPVARAVIDFVLSVLGDPDLDLQRIRDRLGAALPLDSICESLEGELVFAPPSASDAAELWIDAHRNADSPRTFVWTVGAKAFLLGAMAPRLLAAASQCEFELAIPDLAKILQTMLQSRNPWRAEGSAWWNDAVAAERDRTGVELQALLRAHRLRALAMTLPQRTYLLPQEEYQSAQYWLHRLQARIYQGESLIPLVLGELAKSALCGRTRAQGETLRIVGVAAGCAVELRLFSFPGEEEITVEAVEPEAEAPSSESGSWHDGGDVRFLVACTPLDSSVLARGARTE